MASASCSSIAVNAKCATSRVWCSASAWDPRRSPITSRSWETRRTAFPAYQDGARRPRPRSSAATATSRRFPQRPRNGRSPCGARHVSPPRSRRTVPSRCCSERWPRSATTFPCSTTLTSCAGAPPPPRSKQRRSAWVCRRCGIEYDGSRPPSGVRPRLRNLQHRLDVALTVIQRFAELLQRQPPSDESRHHARPTCLTRPEIREALLEVPAVGVDRAEDESVAENEKFVELVGGD